MIKLKKGDYVDAEGLTKDQRLAVIKAFVDAGALKMVFCDTIEDLAEIITSRFIGWNMNSNYVDGWHNLFYEGGVDEIDVDELLAQIRSEDSDENDLTFEEMLDAHKEIRKAPKMVVSCNRNVVFLDYDTSNHEGTLEITVTDGREFNACFKDVGCVDSVEMNLDKEDFVELLKSWRKVINGAIEELED